jgi:hypothetical protein
VLLAIAAGYSLFVQRTDATHVQVSMLLAR